LINNSEDLLTPREKQCLFHLANGLRTKNISWELGVKEVTVEAYIKSARLKLNAKTREQAVAVALKMKLIAV
jgi:DNA-binding CsgD family transcriptional regulator